MAYSTQRAVSDGTLQLLRLSIAYLDRADIQVLIDGILSTAWTWVDDTSIHFNSAVPAGIEVRVKRTTAVGASLNTFSKGAAFTAEAIDEDFTQVLFIAQEAIEGSNISEMFQDLDMHGYKLKNLGLATERNQAVSYGQFLDEAAGPAVSAANALASANAAALSAQNAEVARVSSAASAATAVAAADAAGISEANSKASENASGLSATVAKASEVAAAASAASAAVSAIAINPDAYVAQIGGSTGAIQMSAGTTAQRPVGQLGRTRFNLDTGELELYRAGGWGTISTSKYPALDVGTLRNLVGTKSIQVDNIVDGTAKAWGYYIGGALSGAFNVASITRVGVGTFRVVFTNPMPDTAYRVFPSATAYSNIAALGTRVNRESPTDVPATVNGFSLTYGVYDNSAYVDPIIVSFVVYR